MPASTVTWRQALAAMAAVLVCLGAVVVLVRAGGLDAVDATASRATRWFVHQGTDRVVLADGYGDRTLARLEVGADTDELTVAQGGTGAYLVDPAAGEVRVIDSAALRIGPPRPLSPLEQDTSVTSVGASGLVVVDRATDQAAVLPPGGDPVDFEVRTEVGGDVEIAPDGAVWSIVEDRLERWTSTGEQIVDVGLPDDVEVSLVGNRPLLLDRDDARVRSDGGDWIDLPTDADASELVLQEPSPSADCGWVGAGDELWCVGEDGVVRSVTVEGLRVGGSDRLAIGGDAAVVVRGIGGIVHFDWRDGSVLDELGSQDAGVPPAIELDVTATADMIWVDHLAGDLVWAASPWVVNDLNKNDETALELDDDGQVTGEGRSDADLLRRSEQSVAATTQENEPDNDGVDDPPVAVDDFVTARSGTSVQIPVTANDFDPDGEAIAVARAGVPGHGVVTIGDAATVVYNPVPGFVGVDRFPYTIVDGDGTPATANVEVEILPPDAANRPPVGGPDVAETGPGVPVDIDVLVNDIDPERDPLEIATFTVDEALGEVTETRGPSGLPALRYAPPAGFEGEATFTYRPVDTFEAVGDPVEVTVEVGAGDENRPPITRPDAIRLRRDNERELAVLANDRDPDGDALVVSVPGPEPEGLNVRVDGDRLVITAQAGSRSLVPFSYEVDDGHGNQVRGAVLVQVIGDDEPNQPPLVVPDTATAVIDTPTSIDVTVNDSDPDGDDLIVVDVTQPEGRGEVVILDDGRVQFTPEGLADGEEANARFSYVVTDGFGHEVTGDVTVTVLPEPLDEPPFARDDSATTFVNEPVIIDVLRNDGDPSGGSPSIVADPGCPAGGTAEQTTDGRIRYEPPRDETGTFRCTYEVINSQDRRASAAIIVTVLPPDESNRPPQLPRLRRDVVPGGTTRVNLLDGADDPDGPDSGLTVVSSTAPSAGTAERSGNLLTYTAGMSEDTVTIEYRVLDVGGAVAVGRLTIEVSEPEPRPPQAVDDSRSIESGAGRVTIDVLANDSDPDGSRDQLRVVSVGSSPDASTRVDVSAVTITPRSGFQGTITVPYTIVDPDGQTASATIRLTVTEPANRPPVAMNDVLEVPNGGAGRVAVLNNDSDPDGDPLALSIVSGPAAGLGTATVDGRGIAFTAAPNAAGSTTITYRVSDGELEDTAQLLVTVLPCAASSPVAEDAFLTTGYQQPINVDLSRYAANGQIVDVSAPAGYVGGVYTPPAGQNGNVTISYAVENQCRQRATGSIVIDVNQSPTAQGQTLTIGRTSPTALSVAVLASDDEPLSILRSDGAPAWVSTAPDQLVIDATAGVAVGTYSWSTVVQDPGGLTATVPVTVTVTNVAPSAAADTVDLRGGGAVEGDLLANDSDPDGPNSALRIQTVPGSFPLGQIQLIENSRDVRIVSNGSSGTATFTYRIVDADGAVSDPATVTVTGPPPPTTTVPPPPPTTVPPTDPPPTNPPPTDPPSVTTTTSPAGG